MRSSKLPSSTPAYIINRLIRFLVDRKQRGLVDGFTTNYLSISRGLPQVTVLGPILLSLIVNDICVADEKNSLLVKYADDITVIAPENWAKKSNMSLNLKKTWEMDTDGKTSKPKPLPLRDIEKKETLKLHGITFQSKPTSWCRTLIINYVI